MDMPEPVQRLLAYAGKERRQVRNPNLTAREAITVANWITAALSAQPQPAEPVAELEALRAERDTAIGKTAIRCMEMAMWPQGIDDEQAYYGRMFAEFIEREFKAAIDAASTGGGNGCPFTR